jgi:hypothetical protein
VPDCGGQRFESPQLHQEVGASGSGSQRPRPEVVDPAAHGFIRDHDPALGEQILDVAKAEGELEIEPDRVINEFRREPIRSRNGSAWIASP